MRALFSLLALALSGCAAPAPTPAAAPYDCRAVEGLEALRLARIDTLFLTPGYGAQGPEADALADAAAAALSCQAAALGRPVRVVLDPEARAPVLEAEAQRLAPRGAVITRVRLPPVVPASQGQAPRRPAPFADEIRQAEQLTAALAALRGPAGELLIVAGAYNEASRGALGDSQTQWRPAAALLPAGATLSLKLEAGEEPGLAVRLMGVQDIDGRRAPAEYDGLLTLGPGSS